MTIKTLHLTNCWHERSGGIATFYRALIWEANRQERHIRLVVPGEKDREERIGDFAKIYYLESPKALFNKQYRMIYPSQFLPSRSKLQQILIAERPDLVEVCDKYTLNYLGALLRRELLPAIDFRPAVIGLSCERMSDNFRSYIGAVPFARKFCAAYMKWVYFPFFDHHIVNSAYTAEELREASRGHITARDTWIRPMGIDLEHASPSRRSPATRQRILNDCAAPEDCRLLLYAGRLVPEKNLKLLFEAFELLTANAKFDYRLVIAGDGIERAQWELFCKRKAPGKITFLGHISDPLQLADLLANCDAFVHPNPCEPFGIAPLQAMAAGLPLVAPDRGGITTYANSDNAWLVPPDASSFVSAIEDLFAKANASLRIERRQNALITAANFSWAKVTASFFELYSEICALQLRRGQNALAPDFSSSQARHSEALWLHRISHAAEVIFRANTRIL